MHKGGSMKKNRLLFLLFSFTFISLTAQNNETKLSHGLITRAKRALTPSFIKELSATGKAYFNAKKEFYACIKQYCPQLYQEREKGIKAEEKGSGFFYPWQIKKEQTRMRYGRDIMNQIYECGRTYCSELYAQYREITKQHDRNLAKAFLILTTMTFFTLATIEALLYYLSGGKAHLMN
jgi:hypothetical protein